MSSSVVEETRVLRERATRRTISAVDALLIAVALLVIIEVAIDARGAARVTLGALGASFVPGWAVIRWFRTRLSRLLAIAMAMGIGAALAAIVGSLMLLVSAWAPATYVLLVCALSAIATIVPAPAHRGAGITQLFARRRSAFVRRITVGPRLHWILLCVLIAALLLWLLTLREVSVDQLGQFGLLPVFSPWWYIALAVILVIFGWSYLRGFAAAQATSLLGFTLMLYASTAIIEVEPRLGYVYKHIAVVRLFEVTGTLHPEVDIYNRWPGLFAGAALFGTWTGITSPISYAAIAETVFALTSAGLIFLLARQFGLLRRNSILAAAVFTGADWVGQEYFSPQAFAFAMFLLAAVLITTYLRAKPSKLGLWLEGILARIVRMRPGVRVEADLSSSVVTGARAWRTRWFWLVVAFVLVLQAVVVISHQLTPYIAVLGLIPLCLAGYVRPRWLGFALLAMAILFLIPNLPYVEGRYGLSTGFNFVQNATQQADTGAGAPTFADGVRTNLYLVLTGIVFLLGFVGMVRRARAGHLGSVIFVLWMSLSPVLILAGQNYGGEGRLRAVLFALPWFCIGVGWLAQSVTWKNSRSKVLFAVAILLIASIFTFVRLQPEADAYVPKADVSAAVWLSSRLTPNDLIVGALPASNLDDLVDGLLVDERYPVILTSQANAYYVSVALQSDTVAKKVAGVRKVLEALAPGSKIYIVFSDTQLKDDALHDVAGYRQLGALEDKIKSLKTAERVYDRDGDRIYSLSQQN